MDVDRSGGASSDYGADLSTSRSSFGIARAGHVPLNSSEPSSVPVVVPCDKPALELAEAVAHCYADGGGHGGDEKSSPWGAMANVVNCMVGAGVIGIPWAIRQCGFIMGTIALVFVAYMLTQSGLILIHLGNRAKCTSLESLAVHVLGGWAYYAILITVIAFAFGAMTAYVVILGDVLPPVVALFLPEALSSRIVVVLFCSICIILPLCLMRSMAALSAASALSVIADVCLVGIVIIAGPAEALSQGLHLIGPNEALLPHYGFFAGIGTMSFAFVSHHIAFTVYNSLQEPTFDVWQFIIRSANGIALTLCLIMGLGGDAIFGRHLHGNILNNFTSSGVFVSIAKGLLGLCMVLTNPLESFMARHCAISMYSYYATSKKRDQKIANNKLNATDDSTSTKTQRDVEDNIDTSRAALNRNNSSGQSSSSSSSSLGQSGDSTHIMHASGEGSHAIEVECANNEVFRIFVTLVLWVSSTVLALIFTDLAVVLSFVGCVTASMIGYIIPSVLFFVSYKEDAFILRRQIISLNFDFTGMTIRPFAFIVPTILFFFGFAVMLIGVTSVTGGH